MPLSVKKAKSKTCVKPTLEHWKKKEIPIHPHGVCEEKNSNELNVYDQQIHKESALRLVHRMVVWYIESSFFIYVFNTQNFTATSCNSHENYGVSLWSRWDLSTDDTNVSTATCSISCMRKYNEHQGELRILLWIGLQWSKGLVFGKPHQWRRLGLGALLKLYVHLLSSCLRARWTSSKCTIIALQRLCGWWFILATCMGEAGVVGETQRVTKPPFLSYVSFAEAPNAWGTFNSSADDSHEGYKPFDVNSAHNPEYKWGYYCFWGGICSLPFKTP